MSSEADSDLRSPEPEPTATPIVRRRRPALPAGLAPAESGCSAWPIQHEPPFNGGTAALPTMLSTTMAGTDYPFKFKSLTYGQLPPGSTVIGPCPPACLARFSRPASWSRAVRPNTVTSASPESVYTRNTGLEYLLCLCFANRIDASVVPRLCLRGCLHGPTGAASAIGGRSCNPLLGAHCLIWLVVGWLVELVG